MKREFRSVALLNGWVWAAIDELIGSKGIFCDGDWVETRDQNPNGEIRLIQLADIGDGIFKNKSDKYLTNERAIELKCTFLKKGDLLIARLPEPLGRACIFPLDGESKYVTAVDVCIVRLGTDYIPGRYLLYAINSPQIRSKIDEFKSGSTRKRISRKNISRICLPLPPLPEQHRIVAKIEELFSDLDAGIASLKHAQAQLKTYRQAVLKYAFEGKLTAAWREQNKPESAEKLLAQIKAEREQQNVGETRRVAPTKATGRSKKPREFPPLTEAELAELPELPDGWCWVRMAEISDAISGYAFKSKEFADHGKYQVIKIANIKMGKLTLESRPSFLQQVNDGILENFGLQSGDCIITLTGTRKKRDYGFVAMVKTEKNLLLNQRLAAIRFHAPIHTSYFYYALRGEHFQGNFFKHETGNVGQGNVSIKAITEETIALPSLAEQHQIVQEIEIRLSICDKLEASIKESLQKAEALRQSILKRAFEGKLVPQDPNDEPAEKLLERINASKS